MEVKKLNSLRKRFGLIEISGQTNDEPKKNNKVKKYIKGFEYDDGVIYLTRDQYLEMERKYNIAKKANEDINLVLNHSLDEIIDKKLKKILSDNGLKYEKYILSKLDSVNREKSKKLNVKNNKNIKFDHGFNGITLSNKSKVIKIKKK